MAELCAGILPVWARHLATSRAQSEVAVSQMLKAFADIGPHIGLAERQAQQITQALSQSDGGMTGLAQACERALAPLLADPQARAAASPAVAKVLGLVRHAVDALETIAKPFSQEAHIVAEQVEQMYIGFQYQDRVSQMMALLEQDMARLQATLAAQGLDGPTPTLAEWLTRVESQYAMAEQHQNHTAPAPKPGAPGNDETTFF
jgi:ABC-type transporter Mla subunit MlaD